MRFAKPVVSIAALMAAGGAVAQSTSNCINMGGGMVHCDSMGTNGSTSSTNCTAMGAGMSNCTTMPMGQPQSAPPTPDMSRPQTNGSTLSFIGDLVARSQERSFQKKLGQMLASGDCQGAASFAFAKGRYETSNEIRRSCAVKEAPGAAPGISAGQFMAGQPASPAPTFDPNKPFTTESASPPSATQSDELSTRLRLAAAKANAATPIALDEMTTVSKVEAIGSQILLTANVNTSGVAITDALRSKISNELCANPSSPALLKAGASIRIKYFERTGRELGSVMVTREECGI
jgi:hypothetical protein